MIVFGVLIKSIRRALCAENLTGIGPLTTEIFPVKVASRRKIIIMEKRQQNQYKVFRWKRKTFIREVQGQQKACRH